MTLNRWAQSDAAGTAEAGRFNWAMSVTAPLFMFANLRFRTLLATDTQSTNTIADYFQVRTGLLAIVAMAILAMVAWLFYQGEATKAFLVLAIAAVKTVEAYSDLCCGLQQRVQRMDRIAASLFANGLLMMGTFVAIYVQSQKVVYATLGLLIARLVVLFAYDIPMARVAAQSDCFRPSVDTQTDGNSVTGPTAAQRIRGLLFAALPLGVTAGLLSLTSNIPRYMISSVFNDSMLGIYASLAVTIQAGNLIFRAIELPSMPRLAKLIAKRDAGGFWRLLGKLIFIFVAVAGVGSVISLLFGGSLLTLVFGNSAYETMGAMLALVVVCTAVAQIAGILESSLIAARLTAIQLPMHGVTVGLCFGLSCLLIPRMEILGAVLAVTICRFPFIAISVWLLRQRLRTPSGSHVTPSTDHSLPSSRRAA